MADAVTVTTRQGVAILAVDNPPVNAIGPGIPEAIDRAIRRAEEDASVVALVCMGAGKTFVAGADIASLERAAWGDLSAACDLHPLLTRIEDCSKPVVMAIHGTALGGGLELAMAGHYRVAAPGSLLGQPEVNLGIIPGAEGTQRLPRLVGLEKALDMCVTGKPLRAEDALAAGLVDAVIEEDLVGGAMAFAKRVATLRPLPRTRNRRDWLGAEADRQRLFTAARELAQRTRRGQIAPLKVIEAIEAAAALPFDEGCGRERELFFACVRTDQAKALIHLFFAERAVSKVRGLPQDASPRPVSTVAVVGAGTMGGGIATACANAGLNVTIRDSSGLALEAGLQTIRRNYESSIARGRLTQAAADERLGRIRPVRGNEGFDTADVIIEAVFENLELKKQVFGELDAAARPGAVLATNTSTLDIDAIAAVTARPESVIGLHFFSPASVMRLLEVVRGRKTGPDVIATAIAFGKRLGKVPVVVGNCRGFVGNRMMFPYMYEAQFLVEEGATPEQVDRALTEFGMAMGIFAVDDMAGIDVAWRVRQELGGFDEPGVRKPLVADKLYEMGRYGQKTGAGWYRYDEKRKPVPDPVVVELIRRTAREAGIPQRTIPDEEVVDRCIYALVNEGARVLEDGSADRASDIDVIYANGYGFPSWRGGPMFHADLVGLSAVHRRIEELHAVHGSRWTPAPLLTRLAESGGTFRALDRSATR